MPTGICKLCLKEKKLCRSHLVPGAVYALCRAEGTENPNPMIVTHEFETQTSRQMQIPLLCFDCEQLLRERGEDWVIPQLARLGGPFLLGDRLERSVVLHGEPDFDTYLLNAIPEIRAPELTHFAMGIFWKASVHPWKVGTNEPRIDLGRYGELVRLLLLGEGEFPADMALSLTILPSPVTMIAFHPPYTTVGPDPTFHLYLCGLNYTLWMVANVEPQIIATSLNRPPHVVLVVDNREAIARKFRDAHQSAQKRKQARRR